MTTTKMKKNGNNNKINSVSSKNVNKPAVSRILVKPKVNQAVEKTLADMKEKINPCDVKFNNISKRNNGSIVIECDNVNDSDDIRNKIETQIGQQYEVRDIQMMKPRVKIFGMSEPLNGDELIELLKHQNAMLVDNEIEVIKIVKDIKDERIHNAIIQTDVDGFNKLMKTEKVFLNWDVCAVREHFSILRCHKCAGYEHTKEMCTKAIVCGYCSGDHLSNECDTNHLSCPNCKEANDKFKLSLNVKHHAWSKKCSILSKKIQRVGNKIAYDENK